MERLPELGVLSHPVAIAADRDEMSVVCQAIDERGRHDLIAEDVIPFFEALAEEEPPGLSHR